MASQQLTRRENPTSERQVHLEKDMAPKMVPKMTTHFDNLAEKANESDITGAKEPRQALQGGDLVKGHAGRASGYVGGRGKARETHELGAHFEPVADKVKVSDHAATVVGNQEREGGGCVRDVGKFEMKTEGGERGNKDREELETREVKGRPQRGRESEGQVIGSNLGAGNEGASATEVITCTLEKCDSNTQKSREESESGKSTLEQVSNYRDQASRDLKERYERAKQLASETLSSTAQTATQAKDATVEKGQQGCAVTKDTISSAAKTASEKAAPVAEKVKGYTLQAADKAKSAGGATASYVGEKAVQAKDVAVSYVGEKAVQAKDVAVSYVGEKAVQAKDVAVEGGKSAAGYAAKVAADLKDRATAVGWAAAHFSTEKTVEGTKAAAHVVEGAAGYAGQKAAELASKSAGAVKGLAASAGESAKEYTARKKEEAQREMEAKSASQPQEAEERRPEGIGKTVSQNAEEPKAGGGSSQQEGTGSTVLTAIGETVSNVGAKVKKPFVNLTGSGEGKSEESGNEKSGGQDQGKGVIGETLKNISEKLDDAKQREEMLDNNTDNNISEGGSEVLGAVGESAAETGQNMMEPAESVQEHGQVVQGGRVKVAGGSERELRPSVVSENRPTDRAKREGSQCA